MNYRSIFNEGKITAKLAAPLVVTQLLHIAMGFVDLVMVGRLGANELAAGGLGATLWSVTSVTCLGMLMALSPIIAQLKGGQHYDRIAVVFRQGLWLGITVGLALLFVTRLSGGVLTWFQVKPEVIPLTQAYLNAIAWGMIPVAVYFVGRFSSEGLGHTRPIMMIQIVAIVLNVIANYILIYGKFGAPKLGVEGAGWATYFVTIVNAFLILVYLKWGRLYKTYHLLAKYDPPSLMEIIHILKLSLPIAISLVMEIGLFSTVALLMGLYGTHAVAAHHVAINYAAMMYMVPLGVSMAVTIRIGHAIGENNPNAARFRGGVGIGLAILFMSVSATFMFLFPELIVSLYTQDKEVAVLAVNLLFMAALFQLSDGMQAMGAAALRGLKDTTVPMVAIAIAYWLVGFPCAWLFGIYFDKGPVGLWGGLISGLSFAAMALLIRFNRLSKVLIDKA